MRVICIQLTKIQTTLGNKQSKNKKSIGNCSCKCNNYVVGARRPEQAWRPSPHIGRHLYWGFKQLMSTLSQYDVN